jgi:hypothetical protein
VENYVLENLHEFEAEQLAALTPDETSATNPSTQGPEYRQQRPSQRPAAPVLTDEELETILLEMSDEELEELLL